MDNTILNTHSLVDITTVQVDKTQPREGRILEFVRQIKNPYLFKCGNFTITARYADPSSGITLEECLLLMAKIE